MTITKRTRVSEADGKPFTFYRVDVKALQPGHDRPTRVQRNCDTKNEALDEEARIRSELKAGTWNKTPPPAPIEVTNDGALTFAKYAADWMANYCATNNKPSTIDRKEQHLRDHLIPFFGDMPLHTIGKKHVEQFKALMAKKKSAGRARKKEATKWAIKKRYGAEPKPLSKKTINNVLSCFSTLMKDAADHDKIQNAPRVKWLKAPKAGYDFLDFDEAQRLIDAADPEWRTCLLLALRTGLRQGEIIGLQWADIILTGPAPGINVRRTIWEDQEGSPKGNKERFISIAGSKILAALKEHKKTAKGAHVFVDGDGKRLTDGKMKWPLTRSIAKAGIERTFGRIGWHDLRHTYASHLAMRGVDLLSIKQLLGHTDIATTMKYAHLLPSATAHAVASLDAPPPQ